MSKNFKQYWYVLICMLLFSNTLYAAKVASSKSYLKKLDVTLQDFGKSFGSLKSIIGGAGRTKSFVSTDFWGLQHALYIDYSGNLSTTYPFTEKWLNPYRNYKKYSSNYVRNINGIIFSPLKAGVMDRPNMWREDLNIEFNFHPGYNSSKHYQKYILKYLSSNGVPQSKIKKALAHFDSLATPATQLLVKKAYMKMDSIYNGTAKFGDVKILERIAGKIESRLDLDSFYTPKMHKEIYPLLMKNSGDIGKTIKSKKALYGEYYNETQKYSIWKFYQQVSFSLSISVPVQYFEVARGMSKSKKYNSLMQLKDMLDKKVASGKVKISKNGKYTVYEDSIDKYTHGRIGVDFKKGYGYWQVPFWNSQKYVSYYMKKISKDTDKVNIAIKNYLNICLEETVKKYKNSKSQTNDF